MEKYIGIEDAIPCSICGSKPKLSGGNRSGRLICPNYKSKEIKHGNLDSATNGLPMGFTDWCHFFWNEEQSKTKGIPILVEEWNSMHSQNRK